MVNPLEGKDNFFGATSDETPSTKKIGTIEVPNVIPRDTKNFSDKNRSTNVSFTLRKGTIEGLDELARRSGYITDKGKAKRSKFLDDLLKNILTDAGVDF